MSITPILYTMAEGSPVTTSPSGGTVPPYSAFFNHFYWNIISYETLSGGWTAWENKDSVLLADTDNYVSVCQGSDGTNYALGSPTSSPTPLQAWTFDSLMNPLTGPTSLSDATDFLAHSGTFVYGTGNASCITTDGKYIYALGSMSGVGAVIVEVEVSGWTITDYYPIGFTPTGLAGTVDGAIVTGYDSTDSYVMFFPSATPTAPVLLFTMSSMQAAVAAATDPNGGPITLFTPLSRFDSVAALRTAGSDVVITDQSGIIFRATRAGGLVWATAGQDTNFNTYHYWGTGRHCPISLDPSDARYVWIYLGPFNPGSFPKPIIWTAYSVASGVLWSGALGTNTTFNPPWGTYQPNPLWTGGSTGAHFWCWYGGMTKLGPAPVPATAWQVGHISLTS